MSVGTFFSDRWHNAIGNNPNNTSAQNLRGRYGTIGSMAFGPVGQGIGMLLGNWLGSRQDQAGSQALTDRVTGHEQAMFDGMWGSSSAPTTQPAPGATQVAPVGATIASLLAQYAPGGSGYGQGYGSGMGVSNSPSSGWNNGMSGWGQVPTGSNYSNLSAYLGLTPWSGTGDTGGNMTTWGTGGNSGGSSHGTGAFDNYGGSGGGGGASNSVINFLSRLNMT